MVDKSQLKTIKGCKHKRFSFRSSKLLANQRGWSV